jgi:hypothetical protein
MNTAAFRIFVANVALVLVDFAPQVLAAAGAMATMPLVGRLNLAFWPGLALVFAAFAVVGLAAEALVSSKPGWSLVVRAVGSIESWADVSYQELDINPDPNEDPYEGEVSR